MNVIDLRSDTVTLPPPEMRAAMAAADLGDDVFGEDPTVNRLQEMAAQLLGKEAALLTTSGTQSNLVALLTHCQRGDEVIVGDRSHTLEYEVGGAWALGGLGLRPVPNDDQGRLDDAHLRASIRRADDHSPPTALICLENTHNLCGGTVLSEEDLASTRQVADEHGLPIHMDGARLFNAAVALRTSPARLAAYADSVCFSLSKGLACPVGSLLCGNKEFIANARRYRKMLGGGMRQAGVIAAAGLYALEHMVERLSEDHENARAAADALTQIPGVALAPPPQTNLIYFTVQGWDPGLLVHRLQGVGVRCFEEGGRVRWVTHYGIRQADVLEAVARLSSIAATRPQ